MKLCKSCGQTKPLSDFYANRTEKDGRSFYCKPCIKAKNAASLLRPKRPRLSPAAPGMKRCNRCKLEKPIGEFPASKQTHDGVYTRCKACSYECHNAWRLKNLEKTAADQKRWRRENAERAKDGGRKSRYGVPLGWYAAQLAAQERRCAACKTDKPGGKGDFHVDHCHETGQVRGLLCQNCNIALGHIRHDPQIALALIDYLARYKTSEVKSVLLSTPEADPLLR